MKLCIPVEADNGIESKVYGHFGSAPVFILWDSESGETESLSNQNSAHEHGACSPVKALGDSKVDAVVVGGIGARAIEGLNSMGIQVLQASSSTVAQVVAGYQAGTLNPLDPDNACAGHGGSCEH